MLRAALLQSEAIAYAEMPNGQRRDGTLGQRSGLEAVSTEV